MSGCLYNLFAYNIGVSIPFYTPGCANSRLAIQDFLERVIAGLTC